MNCHMGRWMCTWMDEWWWVMTVQMECTWINGSVGGCTEE